MTLYPPQTVPHWLHFPVLEFLHGKQATNLQTEILRPDHRMARLTSLQWEMRVLGCILLVYFSTGTVSSQSTTVTTAAIVSSPAPAVTSKTVPATVSPSATLPTTPTSTPSTPHVKPASIAAPTTAAPASSGRKFDSASFIGGIILGMVLTAILILAYKWWQKRNKSYHSL